MKNYIISLFSLLGMLTLLAGCEKELMDFEGKDTLFFDVRRGANHLDPARWPHEFYTDVSFGSMTENEKELTLTIRASGEMKDYDRPFQIVINNDSTTAVAERDFSGFNGNCIIKAGETSTSVRFKVFRTKEMDGDTLRLQLKLVSNEYFDLKYKVYQDYTGPVPPTENVEFARNRDASIHNLYFHDVLSMPRGEDGEVSGWYGQDKGGNGFGLFGNFSPTKFRLMMKLTNTTVGDYKNKKTMPMARAQVIGEIVAEYLLKQAKSRETVVLDEDGTMMYVMAVEEMGGSKGWRPFTKPEDYFK